MQPDTTALIQQLAGKLQHWSRLQEQLLRENDKLRQQLEEQRELARQSQQEIQLLKEQIVVLQTAAGSMDDASRKAFEKRINQYLRDIDKVIAYLNTQL
jgi:spore coat protein CotH